MRRVFAASEPVFADLPDDRQGFPDFFGSGFPAGGETDELCGFLWGISHGKQHMGGRAASGGAGSAGRSTDALQIQPHDHFLGRDAGKAAAGGADAPDLYCAEAAFILKYAQGDAAKFAAPYADLGIDIDADIAAADIAQYSVDIGTRPDDGKAVADLLFGKASPSGKLPVTFYRNEALGEMPGFTDYSMKNRTYRYYTGKPLYSFGYGLTYGDVAVTGLMATRDAARVTLENRGRATEEVVQLYIRDNGSPDAPANPILCGFLRVSLGAGEVRSVDVPIDPAALTVVDEAGHRIPGSGSWTLYAGLGQPDDRTRELTGKKAVSAELILILNKKL